MLEGIDGLFNFISNTYGIQFFLQYLGGKVIDKIIDKPNNKNCETDLWYQLFDDTLKMLCEKMEWEYDSKVVYEEIVKNNIEINDLNDKKSAEECLLKLVGKESFNENLSELWCKCLKENIKEGKYEILFKDYSLNKIEKLINNIGLLNDEIDKLKVKNIDINDKWKERERIEKEERYEEEYYLALQYMEDKNYIQAIESLKKINVWSAKNRRKKYLCCYQIGYCYSQIAIDIEGYKKALIWFGKAENICNMIEDDLVLLYRNIALLYIYIGEINDKVENYNKSNNYLSKALISIDTEDDYYFNDILIHISRNYMDMCDELPLEKVNEKLDLSEVLMLGICVSESNLSEEQFYVLLHNLARVYYHQAEKNGQECKFFLARDLFIQVSKMRYIKADPPKLAMVNVNIGLTYEYDLSGGQSYIEKALIYYELAKKVYESNNEKKYLRELSNVNLGIASAHKILFKYTLDNESYEKSNDLLNEIIQNEIFLPNNSLLLRTYLLKLSLLLDRYKLLKICDKKELNTICITIEIFFQQVNYDKYKYTFLLLRDELMLLQYQNEGEYYFEISIENLHKEIIEIVEATSKGNVNISDKAKELLEKYAFIFSEIEN